jgi:hypothetical protein
MSTKVIYTSLISAVLFSGLIATPARSDELASLMSICDSNPLCSHEAANSAGGVLFKIQSQNSLQNIFCQKDGECMGVMPRGKKRVIADIAATIMAH